MEEHHLRYKSFCEYLSKNNYTVITSNLRGHGKNTKDVGFFSNNKGYDLLIKDQELILNYIKETYKVDTIYLFAHSFGTIIARNLLHNNSKYYNKVILSGYPNYQVASVFGIILANIIIKFKGPKYYSKFLHDLAIGSFDKTIKNPKTDLDWLSYNEDNINNYIKDKYCGEPFKVSALRDLFVLLKNMNNKKLFNNINKELNILLLRGESDPCTGFDKGSNNSINSLNKIGFNTKEIKYKNMRHEILNENNNDRVYKDILNYLNK